MPDRHAAQLGGYRRTGARNDDEGRQQGPELSRDDDDEDRVHELALAELGEKRGAYQVYRGADGEGHRRGYAHGLDPREEDLHHEDPEPYLLSPEQEGGLLEHLGEEAQAVEEFVESASSGAAYPIEHLHTYRRESGEYS